MSDQLTVPEPEENEPADGLTESKRRELTSVHARARAFLAAYAETASVRLAADAAGIGMRTHYRWLHRSEAYRAAFERAREIAADTLESEAVRRAHEGVDEPVFQGGKQVGTIRRYSDRLLELLLRGAKPDKFGRQQLQHSGAIETTPAIVHVYLPDNGRMYEGEESSLDDDSGDDVEPPEPHRLE